MLAPRSSHPLRVPPSASLLGGERAGGGPSCALVGSSPALLRDRQGGEIDAHDVVVRFKFAPSGGRYAAHVGNRTSVRVMSLCWAIPHARADGTLLVRMVQKAGLAEGDAAVNADLNIAVMEPSLLTAFGQSPHNRSLSAGTQTAILALRLCSRVSLFGFDLAGRAPGHYFDDETDGIVPALLQLAREAPERLSLGPQCFELAHRHARINLTIAPNGSRVAMLTGCKPGGLTRSIRNGYRKQSAPARADIVMHPLLWERSLLRSFAAAGCLSAAR
jgi:hypothetical protein